MSTRLLILLLALVFPVVARSEAAGPPLKQADGYVGVWYQNQRLGGEYVFKYSGGLGTYSAKHRPFAVYRPEVNKTFFCYGGVDHDYHERYAEKLSHENLDSARPKDAIHHMVSYYDHNTGTVPKPGILLNKNTHDAHDNPVISVDDGGRIWIFSTTHGNSRTAYVRKSTRPYDISEFEDVRPFQVIDGKKEPIRNFSYMQAWHLPKKGFVYFFTKYEGPKRRTCFASSADGIEWKWTQLADIEDGHYQISAATADKAATAFNYHPKAFMGDPKKRGLNWRTNLYYMETPDQGKTWRTADGTALEPPLAKTGNPALIRDFEKEGLLVYLKDITFDSEGRPLILFITSEGYQSGPENNPRTWRLARWDGSEWVISDITTSDNNYDMGSLYHEGDGSLRVIAPTETGPQPFNPGGEIGMWLSKDKGGTWNKQRQLTSGSPYNHTYVRRPVDADPGFYGFWADGHGREPSLSRLYFCNSDGDVFMLPSSMENEMETPERIAPGKK